MALSGRPENAARRMVQARRARVLRIVALAMFAAAPAWGDASSPTPASDQGTDANPPNELSVIGAPAETKAEATDAEQPPYEDQYLFEGELPVYDDGSTTDNEPFGQRLFVAELAYYRNDDDLLGDEVEQGGRALWRRETLHWGIIDAELQFSEIDSDYLDRSASGTDLLFTFRQSAMPVSDNLTLDNTVGHHRTRISSLLHSGFRYRLPSSPILGTSSTLVGTDSSFRFTTGKTGTYRGVALPHFEETGGNLTTLAYETRLNEDVDVGGEVAVVDGESDVRDHTSLLLAGRYTLPEGAQEHAARLLADDDGNLGVWTDSYQELRAGPTVRYGGFYFAPDLAWTDEPISSDQMGLYLRGDIDSYRYTLSGGYDYLETGLGSDGVGSSNAHSTFFTSNLRASRDLGLGLNGNLAFRQFSGGLINDDQVGWRVNSFVSLMTNRGQARLEVFNAELNSDIQSNERSQRGFWTSFDWRLPQDLRLTNEVRVEWNEDLRGDTRRDEFSTLMRYDPSDNISLSLNGSLYRTEGDTFSADNGYSFNADARWAFLRNWFASLSVNYNAATYDIDDAGLLIRNRTSDSNSIWLNFGYAKKSGRPHQTFGRTNGRAGTGRISGQVFFDENRDSIRQPTERAAAGVVVLLDGRYETRTDAQGRFSFVPVPTGRHEIRLLTEDVPLPWGLDDERARPVEIGFRRESRLDFPLQRIN